MKCGCDNGRIIIGFSFNELPIWEDCPTCGDHVKPEALSAWKDIDRHKMSLDPINGDIEWDGSYYSLLDKIAKYEEELKRMPAKEGE